MLRHPDAHVYHYAAYEETAIKRLAMFHGTREGAVDDLLRSHRLVDLYRVVREAVRTSEPGYSIKNMERFYLAEARGGEVTNAGDSIVIYERWRRTGEPRLLDEIADYNRIDCSSTLHCRDWLVGLRASDAAWLERAVEADGRDAAADRTEAEARVAAMSAAILAGDGADENWRRLLVDLLEFHRRESKPSWWAVFSRQDLPQAELLEDAECLAGLTRHPDVPPRADKRSTVWTFRFPAQDFKLRIGDSPKRAGTLEPAGEVVAIDEDGLTIELKLGPSRSPIADGTALIPAGPVGDKPLRAAVYRYAEAVRDGRAERYGAVTSILKRDLPAVAGRAAGAPVVGEDAETVAATIEALLDLRDSHLVIQGPPGAGKTYTASQAIVALLMRGKRVGIASNGHKAINQLLREVETLGAAQGLRCRGIKKSSRDDQMLGTGGWIEETLDNDAVTRRTTGSSPARRGYSPAPNTTSRSTTCSSTRRGRSGLPTSSRWASPPATSSWSATRCSSPNRSRGLTRAAAGSRRSTIFWEDMPRCRPNAGCSCRRPAACIPTSALSSPRRSTRGASGPPPAPGTSGCSPIPRWTPTRSRPPVSASSTSTASAARSGRRRRPTASPSPTGPFWVSAGAMPRAPTTSVGTEDILVVSPYNMQVELLKRTLPPGARVGTVDKFQGQEAAVVLISMATSSGDDLPRNIEFLYSRNRLNVAISRARCLAVVYANRRLLRSRATPSGRWS